MNRRIEVGSLERSVCCQLKGPKAGLDSLSLSRNLD